MSTPLAPSPAVNESLALAFSGDQVMLGDLAALAVAFSVRVLVAGLILAVTLWAAKRLARAAEHGVEKIPVTTPPTERSQHSPQPWCAISSSRSA